MCNRCLLQIFSILFVAFAFSCNHNTVEEKSEAVKATVTITHPVMQNVSEYIELNGVTQFQIKDNIRAVTTGYITGLRFRSGDPITAGQVFCTIETKEQSALKNIDLSDSSLANFRSPLSVIANTTGVLNAIYTVKGNYVAEGDLLATVSDPASLIVLINVPYEYHEYSAVGKSCEILLPGGKTIETTITGIMPTVDSVSQSQTFFIRIPAVKLPENLNITIRLLRSQKNNALCIASSALQTDEMQKEFWLMKVINDSIAIKVPVQTGLKNDSVTEIITDKISVSDSIILEGAYGLNDSILVTFEK
jgi:biotin carboxyl carrier protein